MSISLIAAISLPSSISLIEYFILQQVIHSNRTHMNIFYLLCLFVGKWDESVLHHLLILILDEILPLPSIYWADTSKSTAKTSSGSHSSAAHVRTSSQGSSEQVDTRAFIPTHVPPSNNEVSPPTDEVLEGV